ncbi:SRPBCC family protein [Candidatus Lucifugimonas marina]|uniref:SRPBCC family protein n=1 Tax=Candidatus Lucifugimonas marina TaxID=3038979 RepID=A0AAJ6CRF8_9CHLR|nr:hypothetical protein [SAR202 cluster bacterium JH639]WFG35221.1 hypothetical protein GKN94_05775 [SAR202 cluster bacterium JH545]WFG39171.1 hypothetical protein GKO48_05905 [SAR202 cluster bacterium JH1073]
MATIGTSGSGTINKPAEEVWKFMADPALLHHWVKDIESGGEWINGGTDGVVGSRYRVDYSYGRKTNEIVFEVTASESPRRFAVNTVSGPYPITADYILASANDGQSTDVKFEMVARSDSKFTAVMFLLTGWFAGYFMKRQLNKELVDLQVAMSAGVHSE